MGSHDGFVVEMGLGFGMFGNTFEMIQQTETPTDLGPCPLVVKSEPADEEPSSDPPPRPLWLQDLTCKEKLPDDWPPYDDAQPDAAAASQVPASPTVDSDAPATEALLPSRQRRPEATAGPQHQQQQGWAEYAEPIKGELDIEDWEPPAEDDSAQEAAAHDPLLPAPLALSKLQPGPKKSDSFAGSRAAPTALVQQQLHGGTNCDQNFVSKNRVCKQILPKTQLYTCEKCGAQFANKCNFHKHTRNHTEEGWHKCKVCGKYFSRVGSLLAHTRTHTREGNYKCKVCGKYFFQASILLKHKQEHTGERPFKCDVCGSAFMKSGYLLRHTRTHTGEKLSGKAFMLSYYLVDDTKGDTGLTIHM